MGGGARPPRPGTLLPRAVPAYTGGAMPTPSTPEEFLAECRALQGALRPHPTLARLRRTPGWPDLAARLAWVLSEVRRFSPAPAAAPPAPGGGPLRAVHWNIEKANRGPAVQAALCTHPRLRGADVVLLNEVDLGMARSGNRDVAAALAGALGLHAAWAPMFLETTAGRDDDPRLAAGIENREGLLGLAVLARWPLGEVRIVELPSPQRVQFDVERMYGRHVGLAVEVLRPGAPFVAVSTHLEVHRTRAHRTVEMRTLLEALRGERRPVALAGDLNAHTLDRGGLRNATRAALALLLAPEESLERRFRRPYEGPAREGLFEELGAAGFEWEPFNDPAPTLALRLDRVPEVRGLARLGGPLLRPALARMERRARLKLDWFAGRGWAGGRGGTVEELGGPAGASDHAPIVAELAPHR